MRCCSAKLVNVQLTVNHETLTIHDPGELYTIFKTHIIVPAACGSD